MNEKSLDITPELQQIFDALRGNPSGEVSESHHLRGFNACADFTQGRATRRFVEANIDMLVHHFIKTTTDVDGLNALTEGQHERHEYLAEQLTEFLLTVRKQILEDKS